MPKLSVLYVVRNEQDHIEKSLKSIEAIADEIVIIDTGSMDRTLSICRKFHYSRIYSHSWVHDFSKTKNYGIKQCKGDWILCMDADEMLDKNSASIIKTAVNNARNNIAGFSIHIADHEASFDAESPINPKSYFQSPQVRVFRKLDKISFYGKVFETVIDSVKLAGAVDVLNATIHHHLWRGKGQEFKNGRLSYYAKLGGAIPTEGEQATKEIVVEQLKQTGIVICAHNVLRSTKECIASISRHTKSPHYLQLVDNGSSDGTFEYMQGTTGRKPVKFQNNVGIARAKNAGAREILGNPNITYLCFLDNDTKVTENWLEIMTSILDRNPKIGLIGPLSNQAETHQNIFDLPNSRAPLQSREPEFFFADTVGGFCQLMPISVARSIGLFDESFGEYGCEDKDLCTRVRQLGLEIAVANRVFVEHAGKATVVENKMDWQKMFNVANTRYVQKWAKTDVIPAGIRSPKRADIRHKFNEHPKMSFVILTHNRLDMTRPCIESILATTDNFELIVVDNASTDSTVEWVKNAVPSATIIKNNRNFGVPIARNQGLKATTSDIIIVMDNDVVLKDGWQNEMLTPLSGGADAVGLEGWQLDANHAPVKKCVSSNERFDYLGGAFTVFRRKIFETIGLLDEGFSPAYFEDVDQSIRAKAAGFRLVWNPSEKVVHKEHATLVYGQKDFVYQEALSNSYVRFAKKMRGELKVDHEVLEPITSKKYKILYLGMQYDYGVIERGTSFEHDNFFPALNGWDKTKELKHFDFVQLGKQHGLDKMSDMLYEEVQNFQPDALFGIWFDQNHDPRRPILKKISTTTPCKTIGWFCDSHWRYETFDKSWAEFLDFNVTTSKSGHEKYIRDGLGSKVIKSQWAVAPNYKKLDLPRDIDVSFVGQPHGDRRIVIDQIRKAGIDVNVWGTGWGNQRLTFDQMINVFNRSKINLNLNNACDTSFKQIKGRNFEVPGCGGFLLTGTAENLHEYYKYGQEIETYENTNEMIEKIRYYLQQYPKRELIANAGYYRTMSEHTYTHRFEDIFSTIFGVK